MKLTKVVVFISLISSFSSCSDWLDVEPKTEIKSDIMFESESGFKDAIIGCYILMSNSSLYGKELTSGFMDVIAQLFSMESSASYAKIKDYEYDKAESIINNIWSQMYTTIANVNNILENIDDKRGILQPAVYQIIKGEALGLRAFLHFELLRMYGWGDLAAHPEYLEKKCIPYVVTYDKVLNEQYTEAKVLEFIHRDLQAATDLLEKFDPWSTSRKDDDYDLVDEEGFFKNRMTRFNYWAVQATMARVCMWEGRKDKALPIAQNFIKNQSGIKDLAWITDQSINNEKEPERDLTFSTEHIFRLDVHKLYEGLQILIDPKYNYPEDNLSMLYHDPEYAKKLFEVTENIGNSDYRYARLYTKDGSKYANRKFYEVQDAKFKNMMPLIRMSEMYYIAAEALNAANRGKEAVELLNIVRRKRGIAEVNDLKTNLSAEDITEEIEKEWRKEFLGEGQMFYFYKRLGYSKIPNSNIPATELVYVLQIPEDEINVGGREPNVSTDKEK